MQNIYSKIEEHFKNSNDPIWIYEERPWKEAIFCFNVFKQNTCLLPLRYLKNPIIWPFRP